ncbi:MAG TPA: hypothetical protein PLQ22_01585 [Bacilli bacterium]|nr:hypothetical protein [Bacilli bacterium]
MRKVIKIIFATIMGIVLCIGLSILTFYLLLTAGTANPPEELYVAQNQEFSFEDILQKSLMNTKEDQKVKLTLTEDELNKLIYSLIVQEINPDYYKTEEDRAIYDSPEVKIRSVYGEIKDKYLYIRAHVDSYIDVLVTLKLEIKQTETDFKLVVKKLQLGKFNLTSGLGRLAIEKILLPQIDLEAELNNNFEESDIPVKFTWEDLSFTLTKADIKTKVNSMLAESMDNPSYGTIISELLDTFIDTKGVINLGISENDGIGLVLDVTEFAYDGEITAPRFDFEVFKTKILTLDENGVINNDNSGLIISYLLVGYANISEENRAIINACDFSSIGIADKTAHLGYANISTSDENIEDDIINQLYSEVGDLSDGLIQIGLDEATINNILAATPIIGEGFSLYRSNSAYEKYTFVGVESLFCDVVNDGLSFSLALSLNGQRLLLSTSLEQDTLVTTDVKLELTDISLGNYHMSAEAKEAILGILGEVVGDNELILIQGNTISIMTSDLTSFLNTEEGVIDTIIDETLPEILTFELVGVEGITGGALNVKLNLVDFKTTQTLPDEVKEPFVQESFVTEQALRILFSDTAGTSEIRFTDLDINRKVYQDTHQYADLASSELLPDGETTLNITVEGIIFHFYSPITTVEYLVKINGLKTRAYLELTISNNDSPEVILTPSPTLLIGTKNIDSQFLLNYLSASFTNNDVLKYDEAQGVFKLSANSFYELMTVGGSSAFTVDKIKIHNGGINITVSVSEDQLALLAALAAAQAAFDEITQQDFFDPSLYNTLDPEQAAAIEEMQNQLEEIKNNQLNGEPISEEDINALLDNVNGLSEENKGIFFDQVSGEFDNQGYAGLLEALELAMYL